MSNYYQINQPKTWFLDLDGTLVNHNGYKYNNERLLDGVVDFFTHTIQNDDTVIITTSRSHIYKASTINFLQKNNIRYNHIIFDLPKGERILINDRKPDGIQTAYAINLIRNKGLDT